MDLVVPRRVGPHRLDADQVLQVGTHRRQHLTDSGDEITHAPKANSSRACASASNTPRWAYILRTFAAGQRAQNDRAIRRVGDKHARSRQKEKEEKGA
ncbi:hypothetical protein MAUB_47650 [Mycolicibacterium aubagnense]|uniref:Uncharacterized protein n=1 Tax=Mycolicibacterium aubagnense TaxID=319707 RepID=A0ABN5YYF1_9MYCO|nr:hypothetical protein MAUB_47650 [Mycolicibacterium aubagnense]